MHWLVFSNEDFLGETATECCLVQPEYFRQNFVIKIFFPNIVFLCVRKIISILCSPYSAFLKKKKKNQKGNPKMFLKDKVYIYFKQSGKKSKTISRKYIYFCSLYCYNPWYKYIYTYLYIQRFIYI